VSTDVRVTGGGDPTDEEVAAIVAAVEVAWPRAAADPSVAAEVTQRWRFSGRWWTKPVPLRRSRPW
jgi:Acyl-CoA carboxylase epsilon subunit